MVRLRDGFKPVQEGRILSVLDAASLSPEERKEIDYYRRIREDQGEAGFFKLLVDKSDFIRVFQILAGRLAVGPGMEVLELGAGQGWASCMVKHLQPAARVTASDISREALLYSERYEQLLGVALDEIWECSIRNLPFAGSQFDILFAFASLHHFGRNRDYTGILREVYRLLRPGGRAVFLYENAAPGWILPLARWRAQREMQGRVEEDVLNVRHLRSVCRKLGCRMEVEYWPHPHFRVSAPATLYMACLDRLRFLAPLLPCTVNLTVFKEREIDYNGGSDPFVEHGR